MKTQTQISSISGKSITIDFEKMTATIPDIISGAVSLGCDGPIPLRPRQIAELPATASGATHYIAIAKKYVVISPAEAKKLSAAYSAYTSADYVARKTRLHNAIPGLQELIDARDAEEAYRVSFDRMMDDEYNDGVNPPAKPIKNSHDIAKKYPRAATYLKAEAYTLASHYAKVAAGKKALELLVAGGSIEAAENIMDSWLPKGAYND